MKAFHVRFPKGLDITGLPVPEDEEIEYPIFAQESLEKLAHQLLIPLMTFKRHMALTGRCAPLALPFVKELLSELDARYQEDIAHHTKMGTGGRADDTQAAAQADHEIELSDSEAKQLEQEEARTIEKEIDAIAMGILKKHVVLYHHQEKGLENKFSSQAMMKDGSMRLWVWSSGTQTGKDPRKHQSPYRMKGSADDEILTQCIDFWSKYAGEHDTGLWLSGKNQFILREISQALKQLRPRVCLQQRRLQHDEAQFAELMRMAAVRAQTLDPTETMIQSMKKAGRQKACARRFVPGNSAFLNFTGLPVLKKEDMVSVPPQDRDAALRSVVASEKFTRRGIKNKGESGEAEEDDDANQPPTDEDEDPAVTGQKSPGEGSLVFFWMELHPKAGILGVSVCAVVSVSVRFDCVHQLCAEFAITC